MAIPTQFPQSVTAPNPGALQALALQAGQIVAAQVIGPAPNGGTQVQINGQMLNLVLPMLTKVGETLKFEVLGSGAQIKLAMQVAAPSPQAQALPAPVAMPASLLLPLTIAPSALPPAATSPAALPQAPVGLLLPQAQAVSTTILSPLPVAATAVLVSAPMVSSPVAQLGSSAQAGAPAAPAAAPSAQGLAPTVVQPVTVSASAPPLPSGAVPSATVGAVHSQPLASTTSTVEAGPLPVGVVRPASVPSPAVPPTLVASPYPHSGKVGAEAMASAPQMVAPAAQVGVVTSKAPAPTVQNAAQTSVASTPQAAAASVQPPMSPQQALSQMVQAALPRQDSILSLVTALTMIAGKVALPEPVVRAAQQVLAGRVALDGPNLDGPALQKAVQTSGIFQEAHLARGQLPGAQPDLKTTLLALRQTLTAWLGPQAAMAPAASIAPPARGQVPRAKTGNAAPIDPAAPLQDMGKQLLERTEGALSRLRLHQNASLPDQLAKSADWSLDLPVVVSQHQTVLHIQIHREDEPAAGSAVARGWQMRFALTVPQMGEVGAQVSLRGGATGVMLWAAERQTSDALEGHLVALRQTLAEVGLRPGAVIVRHGEPPAPTAAPSGHVLDERT